MAGNNQGNGNRQRNFSVASNTSTSSFKDNAPINQRTTENSSIDTRRSSRQTRNHTSIPNETRDRASSTGSFLPRDLNRPSFGFEMFSSAQQQLVDAQPDIQDQFRKWFEGGIPVCSNQAAANFGEPTPNAIRAELVNSDPSHVLESRARKQQEAQQRLLQLQELIQNVSFDLEMNPFQHHHSDDKIKVKDTGLDFLRNVPSNHSHSQRATSVPHVNVPRQIYKSPQHVLTLNANGASAPTHHSPQNNLSHDPLLNPKRYSTSSQVNGSLMDVFGRSDPSFDSSNDEVDDNQLDGEENDNLSQPPTPQVLQSGINSARNSVRVASVPNLSTFLFHESQCFSLEFSRKD